ncbi:biotin--[acetyl-CoA-carboxylase] ligase [bacterium]|nr:biotin--[acetyl-CoA-carboxylase] ligase [bacterium]
MNVEFISQNLKNSWLGKSIYLKNEINSTNTWAKDNIKNEKRGAVFIANHQTNGRGLKNRAWEAPAGKNILLSFIDIPPQNPEQAHHLTLLAGIALHEAVLQTGNTHATLKWPNDLLINSKKAGGILCEQKENKIVVGIGLNVNSTKTDFSPAVQAISTSLFDESGKEEKRETIITHILNAYEFFRSQYDIQGISFLKAEWNKRNGIMGKTVRIIEVDNEYTGTAMGLDDQGFLLVKTQNELKQVIAGDLFLV